MFETEPNTLKLPTILEIFKLYKELPNTVNLNGLITERHWPSYVGHFLLTKFSNEEFDFVWQEAKKGLPECELVEARVLKYSTNSHIPAHLDMHEHEHSDLSVIIQLNHPDDYLGGDMVIERQLHELNQGDMLYYTYDYKHGVMKVTKGSRYVVNFRCKLNK